jgi:probable phosphoglycerate mutase
LSTPAIPPTADLCIARHGETDWNTAGILQGWIDVPLNDRGRVQARELAVSLEGAGLQRIYTSPLSRASETAAIIAQQLGLTPPECREGLKERHFGIFQGVPKEELALSNPVLCRQIIERNPAAHFDQGETVDEFADRLLATIGGIADECAGVRALLIIHGWAIDVVSRHVQGLARTAVLPRKPKNIDCVWLHAATAFPRS